MISIMCIYIYHMYINIQILYVTVYHSISNYLLGYNMNPCEMGSPTTISAYITPLQLSLCLARWGQPKRPLFKNKHIYLSIPSPLKSLSWSYFLCVTPSKQSPKRGPFVHGWSLTKHPGITITALPKSNMKSGELIHFCKPPVSRD